MKAQMPKPAPVFVRSQLVTNEEIHKLALKLPGFCSTHYDGTKATISVDGTRWVTNAREVMPKYMDGTEIEIIDHADVRARILEYASGLPGYRGIEFTNRAAHITIAVSRWTEANKKTLQYMYGHKIYLLGATQPF